jgi:uncharacterized membrane protein YkgB
MSKFIDYFGRFALFVIYVWFGILKLLGTSAANPLIEELLRKTISGLTFANFILALGIFEVLIGALFLFSRTKWLAFGLFVIHMIVTAGPLVLLPAIAWQAPYVPTLEGQYIIKNLALIALALNVTFRREH